MSESDEVIRQEIVESNNYESRKGKTYEYIGSDPKRWKMAHIKDFTFKEGVGEVPVYYIGSVKKTDYGNGIIHVELMGDESEYNHVKTPYTGFERCELCGHQIKIEHILINYSEKKWMVVGSSCIGNHHGKIVRKALKVFKDNKIRAKFRELRDKVIPILESRKDTSDAWSIRNNMLEYWAWNMKRKLLEIDPEKTGSRKLQNRIKDMEKVISGGSF